MEKAQLCKCKLSQAALEAPSAAVADEVVEDAMVLVADTPVDVS